MISERRIDSVMEYQRINESLVLLAKIEEVAQCSLSNKQSVNRGDSTGKWKNSAFYQCFLKLEFSQDFKMLGKIEEGD